MEATVRGSCTPCGTRLPVDARWAGCSKLSGSQHHDIQRLGELMITVTWPESDGAMARVVGTRRSVVWVTAPLATDR